MSRSLTTPPSGANAPAFTTVSSSAGFNAGDLVYQKSGSVNPIPDGTATSATFNITSTVNSATVAPSTATLLTVTGGVGGGAGLGFPTAAKLTSGNMVVVYCSLFTSYYYFRIIDENGTEVVAETQVLGVTSVDANYGQICVTALTGGGFAVAGINGSGNLTYGVYSNTGTTVAGPFTDSTVSGATAGHLNIASRPDGSFIVLMNDSTSTQTRFKVYSALGVQVIAWTNVVAYFNIAARCSVAVRSDNSFVVSTWTSSSNIQYYVYSSAGATSTNASVSSGATPNSSYYPLSSTTLTNDSVVFVFSDAGPDVYYRILTSANSLGTLTSAGFSSYSCGVRSVASGGFIIFGANVSYNNVTYSVRNSTGTQTTSGTYYGVGVVGNARGSNYSAVEMASNIAVVGSWMYPNPSSYANPGFQAMFQIVTATSAIRNFSTSSLVTGVISSSVNTYARSGSTPNAASFLASTSTTLTKSISQQSSSLASYVLAPTLVESAPCWFVYTRVMQSGQIVVLYTSTASPYPVKMAVYSSTGVYQTTYTVSTSSYGGVAKCCVLSNGNLVVVYMPVAGTTFTFVVYSPSFAVISTSTFTPGTTPYGTVALGPDISSMTNSRFAFSYYAGSSPSWAVFDSSATQIAGSTISTSYNQGLSIGGTANGGFVLVGYQNGGSSIVYWYSNTSGNSFNSSFTSTFGSSNNQVGAPSIAVSPNGPLISYMTPSGSAGYTYLVTPGTTYSSTFTGSTANANQVFGSTVMPDGSFVCVMLDNSTYYGWAQITPGISASSGSNSPYKSSTLNMTGAIPYSASSNPSVCVAALFDNQFVVVYRDTSTYPRIFISSTTAGTYSTTTVAGTTVSNPAYYPSQSNGYILKGVATTSAPAGGTGVVQTNGPAQLNSQYPSTTTYQAFDSTGTLIPGTKGTITGRNVNMTGGS